MNENEKTTLYYFSGTGNSYFAAKKIAEKIENCELISIASLRHNNDVYCSTGNMGIIFPLYFEGLPSIVLDFVERVRLEKVKFVFTVITRGTPIGSGGIFQLKNILRKRSSALNCGFYLNMPWNYIVALSPPSDNKQIRILENAKKKIIKIVNSINKKEKSFDPDPMFFMNPIANKSFIKKVNMMDKNFSVTDNCNSCGLCKKICPVDNINLYDGRPIWKNECEQCLGCINICPQKAINFKEKKNYKRYYINPEFKKENLLD